MDDVLAGVLSADNAVRLQAEEKLSYATTQRGFAAALASKLSANQTHSLLAGTLLLRFVKAHWDRASYCATVLLPEDKEQVCFYAECRRVVVVGGDRCCVLGRPWTASSDE